MIRIAFADLDGTLIFPAKGCQGDTVAGSIKPDGKPGMFMDSRHQSFLSLIAGMDMIVPTTARNIELFQRVQIPMLRTGWAILSYGGTILTPEGIVDERWELIQRPHIDEATGILEAVLAAAQNRFGRDSLELQIIKDNGNSFYMQGKDRSGSNAVLADIKAWLTEFLPADWHIHLNGKDLAVLPAYLRKENAVRWFLDNVAPADRVTFGLGDSHVDLGFMGECDYLITPRGSQIESSISL